MVKDGKDTIYGEIHEYKDPINVLNNMDFIEGVETNLYEREEVIVTAENNEHTAFTYFFQQDTDGLKRIKEGIWKL